MNRRGMRVIEFYGYALIAGIQREQAEGMLPGYILDMYKMRFEYDAKLASISSPARLLGG